MEAKERPIIISSTRAQKKYVIKSKATNLAELKKECDAAGIDYSGLTFVEAITNTEMRGDNSLLPKEVIYKGKTTDNIVFSLTNPRKNIGSGMDRKEAYALVKEYNLGDVCKKVYGENYTRVSTANLESLIASYEDNRGMDNQEEEKDFQCKNPQCTCQKENLKNLQELAEKMLAILKDLLEEDNTLNEDDIDAILNEM